MVDQRQGERQPAAASAAPSAAARSPAPPRGRVLGLAGAAAAAAPRVLVPSTATPSPQQGGAPRRLGAGGAGAQLPEEQLGRLYTALAAQKEAIATGRQRVDALREDLQDYLAAHPEARLPPALAGLSGALSSLR
jgi:hypothetical protein